jgi:hypothetical protein
VNKAIPIQYSAIPTINLSAGTIPPKVYEIIPPIPAAVNNAPSATSNYGNNAVGPRFTRTLAVSLLTVAGVG